MRPLEIHGGGAAAEQAGVAAARPGNTCADVDYATRKVIEDAGYGPYFTHRTGHGIGMECHEEPYLVKGNTRVLEPGMTFTVEPGIYIEDEFGVRVEDQILITDDGCRMLSGFLPRELGVIGSWARSREGEDGPPHAPPRVRASSYHRVHTSCQFAGRGPRRARISVITGDASKAAPTQAGHHNLKQAANAFALGGHSPLAM